MRISKRFGHTQDWITQQWVKITGRKYYPNDQTWLNGPVGSDDIIKDKFIRELSEKENLEIYQNPINSGLLESFNELELSANEKELIDHNVVDFYERTSNYDFEIWSEWNGFFKPFGSLLSIIFSKRLEQLNLPLSAMQSARGIQSNIIKLMDKNTNSTKWTVWYRILKSTKRVIYSGVYTSCELPNFPGKFLKVVFPLPNGNAMVIMRKEISQNGALLLSSDGKRFGDNGFYFTLTNHKGKHWARFVRSMHEWITVYTDEEGILRADHKLEFYKMRFLNLHYKMTKKENK